MKAAEVQQLVNTVYIMLNWGMGTETNQPPSPEYAQKLIRRRWVDNAADGTVFHIGKYLSQHAKGLSQAQRVSLVMACHEQVLDDLAAGLRLTSRANAPARLRPFIQ